MSAATRSKPVRHAWEPVIGATLNDSERDPRKCIRCGLFRVTVDTFEGPRQEFWPSVDVFSGLDDDEVWAAWPKRHPGNCNLTPSTDEEAARRRAQGRV